MALSGAYADAPQTPGAPRPADGQSTDGRADLPQVLLRLGVSGEGGVPLRLGGRDGNRRERGASPRALAACRAGGLAGGRGIGAERTASHRRTLGGGLEPKGAVITLVPRPCAIRQALEAWGQQPPALPLRVEKPGRTQNEAARRWPGPSVHRQVEGAYRDGRVAQEPGRFVVVHASQLAQQHTQTSAAAQEKAAAAGADHVRPVQARWCACRPAAEAALAAYEGQGPGHRGRRPRRWRSHAVRSHRVAAPRRPRRARRGRPAKMDPSPLESGERRVVEGAARAKAAEDKGWTVLAPPVDTESGPEAAMLHA